MPGEQLIAAGAGSVIAGIGSLIASPSKVNVPEWTGINVGDVQAKTIEDNLKNLDEAAKLSSKATELGAKEIEALLEFAAPGALSPFRESTAALLRGELPQDVSNSVLRSGAARNLALGVSGSNFGANLTLRDLGITSLQAQQQGAGQLGQLASLFGPAYVPASSMFFSPQQRADIAMWDAERQWQRDYLAAQVDAQPEGWQAALGNALMVGGSVLAGSGVSSSNLTNPAPSAPNWASGPWNTVGGGGSSGPSMGDMWATGTGVGLGLASAF